MPKPAALTKVLLNVLSHLTETAVELGDLAAAVSTHYGSAYGKGGRAYVTELKRLEQQRVLRRTINRLRDRKFIIARRIGQRLIISLTSKGRTATLINRFQQAKPNVRGVYTVVIFDIPEDPDQYSIWHSTQDATNITHYESPRIDKLLEDGRSEIDTESRRKILVSCRCGEGKDDKRYQLKSD